MPQLQDDIARQAFAISDVQREALGGARAQGQLANATGRAGTALRALTGFGLAAGAGIGVAAGAVALLTKNLNASGQEAQRLQTLSIRGIDPTAYQQASNQLQILTGDAATAQRAVGSVADAGQRAREALAYDPRSLNVRAFAGLGFDSAREFEQATRNVAGFIEHMRGELQGATETQQDYIRAASVAAGIDPTVIDSVAELLDLEGQAAAARRKANQGDLAAADDYNEIMAKIARTNTSLGNLTPDQIKAAEKYDEVVQHLGLAMKDLKIAVTTSFADDLQEAAETKLTELDHPGQRPLGQVSTRDRPDTRSQAEERTPTARDWADLVLTGGSGRISGRDDPTGPVWETSPRRSAGLSIGRARPQAEPATSSGTSTQGVGKAVLSYRSPTPRLRPGRRGARPHRPASAGHGARRRARGDRPASAAAYDQAAMTGLQPGPAQLRRVGDELLQPSTGAASRRPYIAPGRGPPSICRPAAGSRRTGADR